MSLGQGTGAFAEGVAGGVAGGVDSGEDGYSGSARLMIGQSEFEVEVDLRGHFEPIDGRYHWYGRIASNKALTDLVGGFRAVGLLDTGQGRSPCELTDQDLWDRYRVSGTSTPPFHAMTPGPPNLPDPYNPAG